jgi:hypothetical protein
VADQKSGDHDRTVSASAILESVQSLARQNPEAFGKLVVQILCTLADLDRDAYDFLVGGMFSRELRAAGLNVALEQAKQALSLGRSDRVEERLSAIETWVRSAEYLGSRERLELLTVDEQEPTPTSKRIYVM